MKINPQSMGITFATQKPSSLRQMESWRSMESICKELPLMENIGVRLAFIEYSKHLLEVEKANQAKIISLYPSSKDLLCKFFDSINLRSVRVQQNALQAVIYMRDNGLVSIGLLPDDVRVNLHGVGDNCYEYAVEDLFDPYGKLDVVRNPGFTLSYFEQYVFSGKWKIDEIVPKTWASLIEADVNKFGKKFAVIDYDRKTYAHKSGTTLLAGVYGKNDYHFYHYDWEYGLWTHKRGSTPIAATDDAGNLITDPKTCAKEYYPHFMGYFLVW